MLEYWYKERRTLVDFRRGPLGPYFDGFAAHLKKRGYSHDSAHLILGKCCLFNSFLVDKGIFHAKELTPSLVDLFLDDHLVNFRTTSRSYRARDSITNIIQHLFSYLAGEEVIKLPKSKPVLTRYSWILNPYLKYLQEERQISKTTIQRSNTKLSAFLEGLGDNATRKQLRILKAENIETYVQQHLKDSPENLRSLTGVLRGFLRYCANQGYTSTDLSRIIPSIPSYRLATLPKGMEESALQRLLNAIPKDTPHGARAYYILFYDVSGLLKNPVTIFKIWQGGLSIHGGILAGVVTGLIFSRLKKISFWALGDLVSPSIILGQAVGRIGCYLNGCCSGINNQPTQIYELGLDFIGFLLLWNLRKKIKFQGGLFLLYLMMYAVIRIIVSRFRADNMYLWNTSLTLADLTSVIMFITGMIFFIIRKKHA